MSYEDKNTLELILNAAKEEFLEKGFKSASLRNIVKKAGVTTGAFYGYFTSKSEIFNQRTQRRNGSSLRVRTGRCRVYRYLRKQ